MYAYIDGYVSFYSLLYKLTQQAIQVRPTNIKDVKQNESKNKDSDKNKNGSKR